MKSKKELKIITHTDIYTISINQINKMSANTSVVDGTKIDLSLFSFGKPIRNANGSKSVRVSYNGGPLTIQTPMMNIPWNVNPPYSEKDKKDKKDDEESNNQQGDGRNKISKWSLQMSFKGYEAKDGDRNTARLKKFHENMRAIDKLFLDTIVKNRQEWFDDDKPMKPDTALAIYERLYRPAIHDRKNKITKESYPPTLEPKVNCIDGEFQCNVFTMNREKYDKQIDKIALRGATGEGIVRLTNFYIQQTSCGPTWTLMRLRADETTALSDFGFVDFDEEEGDGNKSKPKNVQIEDSDDSDDDVKPAAGDAEDSSDDDKKEESSEEEPEPEPVKPVKKVVKKKN